MPATAPAQPVPHGDAAIAGASGSFAEAEAARLDALARLEIMDTRPEPAFDDLVQVAAALCDAPIALVSLVDASRQWFKARCGLDATETSRDVAFCAHAIQSDNPFIVPDATLDARFAANPLVLGAPLIRFYAGVPLVGEGGHRYGTLCVIDTKPRTISERQLDGLIRLSRQVLSLLEQHRRTLRAQRNEVMLARAFEAMPDAVITCGPDGRLAECNPAARAWHGLAPGPLPAEEWISQLRHHERDGETPLAPEREPLRRALLGQRVRDEELVIRAKGQPPRTVLCNASPLVSASGQPLGAVAVMHDVTELRSAAIALAGERRRLAMIIDGTNAGTWEWNVQTGETRFNERWAEIVGYTLEELAPISIETWGKLAHPGDLAESNRSLQEHFEGKRSHYDAVCRMRHKDGRWVWVHDRGRVFEWDGQGKPLWMAGSHLDVTLEREATIQVADTRHRLQEIVQGSRDVAIIATDPEGSITIFNPGAERLLGYQADEVLGLVTPERFHLPAELEARGEELALRLGHPVSGLAALVEDVREQTQTRQWTYVRKDGAHRQVRLSVSALHDAQGVLTGYVGIAVDITALLEARELARLAAEKFSGAFSSAALGMALVSLDGHWVEVNDALCSMFRRSREQFLATDFQTLTHPDDLDTDLGLLREVLAGRRESYQMDKRYWRGDGTTVWVRLSVSLVRTAEGAPLHFVAQIQDVTAERLAEQSLSEAEARVRTTLEAVGEAIITTDRDALVTYVNPAGIALLEGRSSDDVVGRRMEEVLALEAESQPHQPLSLAALASPDAENPELPPDLVLCTKSKRTPVVVTKTRLPHADPRRTGAVIILRNATQERARAAEAARLANIDALTGLVNRRGLEAQLLEAARLDRDSSLILLDLDGFKAINDQHGHLAGDEMLKGIGNALRAPVRLGDVVARLGGDEFALLLPACPLPRARSIAEAVRSAIAALIVPWNGHGLQVGASVGVAPLRRAGDVQAALAAADAACYAAKAQGKNRVCVLSRVPDAPPDCR